MERELFPVYDGQETDETEELLKAIEDGRRHKISAEVFCEFLDSRKDEILRLMEGGCYNSHDAELDNWLAELRVMKRFKDICNKMIALGNIAEERMNKIGS